MYVKVITSQLQCNAMIARSSVIRGSTTLQLTCVFAICILKTIQRLLTYPQTFPVSLHRLHSATPSGQGCPLEVPTRMRHYALTPTNKGWNVQQLSPIQVTAKASAESASPRDDLGSLFQASLRHALSGEPSLQHLLDGTALSLAGTGLKYMLLKQRRRMM